MEKKEKKIEFKSQEAVRTQVVIQYIKMTPMSLSVTIPWQYINAELDKRIHKNIFEASFSDNLLF